MSYFARFMLTVLLALCAQLPVGSSARAQTAVSTLGVRSLDGESDFERRLSNQLRNVAASIAGWSVQKREASLAQMTLALGCEEADAACLGEIASTLGVEQLLYGTVVGKQAGYDLTLYHYDGAEQRVHSAVAHALQPQQLRGQEVKETLLALLGKLTTSEPPAVAEPARGVLRVTGDLPGAQIAVDGETRGALDEHGVLSLEVPAGKHTVRAAGAALAPAEEKLVTIDPGTTATVELSLAPPTPEPAPVPVLPEVEPEVQSRPKRSLRRAFGWVAVGLGAAFAAATIYSWARIEGINDDNDYLAYRAAFPRAGSPGGVSNVCARAEAGALAEREPELGGLERRARSLCDEADTLESLQYVFLGGALLSGGAATWLFISARREERERGRTFSIAPSLGAHRALLSARLTF